MHAQLHLLVVVLGIFGFVGLADGLGAQEVIVLEPLPPAEDQPTGELEKIPTYPLNEILGLALTVEGDATVLAIDASDRLGWRSFLDPAGNLVLEVDGVLNEPHSEVEGRGLISEVVIAHAPGDSAGDLPPRTRLTIKAHPQSVHWVASDGTSLRLRLIPQATPLVTTLAPIAPLANAVTPPPAAPVETSRPGGGDGSLEISYRQSSEATVVLIRGNEALEFSELVLEDPPRYVVDVADARIADHVAIESPDSSVIQRIRAAQYRVSPVPVVRVVLDLRDSFAGAVTARGDASTIEITVPSGSAAEPATAIDGGSSPPPIGSFDKEILSSLEAWRTAWEHQRVEAYLGSYGEKFSPANGSARPEWERIREERVLSPTFVELTIEDQVVYPLDHDRARVTFTQRYRSNTFADVTLKTLIFAKEGDRWLIESETTE